MEGELIPNHFEERQLKNLVSINPRYDSEKGRNCIHLKGYDIGIDFFNARRKRYVGNLNLLTMCRGGDLAVGILSKSARRLCMCIIPDGIEDGFITNSCCVMRSDDTLLIEYLFYHFQSLTHILNHYRLTKGMSGSDKYHIVLFKNRPVFIPPTRNEMEEILQVLKSNLECLDRYRLQIRKIEECAKFLLDVLRGKLKAVM